MRYSLIVLILFAFIFNSTAQENYTVETLEIYKVDGNKSDPSPTVLSYKEVKYWNADDVLVQQEFFEVDNTLKSYEIIKKDGESGMSNYFTNDDKLLAIYSLNYDNQNNIIQRIGFDGKTKEHLRSESFKYDENGRISKKILKNNLNEIVKLYDISYDADGNEVGLVSYNPDGSNTTSETYIIAKRDDKMQWLEKWGYEGDTAQSFHRRSFKTITK